MLSLLLSFVLLGTTAARANELTPEQIDFFETQVRPVLVNHCAECHGEDVQEAGLRLDHRATAMKGSDVGPVIVPGDVEASRLVHAIRHQDEETQMPPDEALPAEAVASLETWIRGGAHWPVLEGEGGLPPDPVSRTDEIRETHWSFKPVGNPAPPILNGDNWSRRDLDRFIVRRLAEEGLTPSDEADRGTLIRRAYFDLIGLPPTHEEIEAFANDPAPDAYERLIDRLLAMPEYGQRWARHWLDVARYSDTKGYVGVNRREERYPFAWTYRDYVVRALNEDMPYDEFVLQQLAADQLDVDDESRWQLAGMGFLTVGPRYFNRDHRIFGDRIDLVGRGLMGMTMACAKCHDHKFDPLSMEDYYAMYGVFGSSTEPKQFDLPLLDPEHAEANAPATYKERRDALFAKIERRRNVVRNRVGHSMRAFAADYLEVVARQLPKHRTKENVAAKTDRTTLLGPLQGRVGAVGRWRTYINRYDDKDPIFGLWHRLAAMSPEQLEFEAPGVIYTATDVHPRIHEAFIEQLPQSMVEVARCYGSVFEAVYKEWQKHKKAEPKATRLADADSESLRQVLFGKRAPMRGITVAHLPRFYQGKDGADFKDLRIDIEKLLADSMGAAPARAMTVIDRPKARNARIHLRGDVARKGDEVPRRFLNVLSHVDGGEPFKQGSGRLEMARAIVSPDNPLTPRVIVNRVWGWHFGQGLVDTPSDFGARGHLPTHPELLDFLTRQFMNEGWSLKRLHREIMTSATYRQASIDRAECREVDDRNTLLWKMNRRRRNYEEMRDALLSSSDELDTRLTGAPFDDLDNGRRTLYQFIDRKEIPRLRLTFDFSVPDATLPKRYNSTVPQQALFLLNDGFVTRRARKVLAQMQDEVASGDTSERLEWTYRKLYGREPRAAEQALATRFVEQASSDKVVISKPGGLAKPWQYGTGRFDRKAQKLVSFNPISHFDGRYLSAGADSVENGGAFASVDGGRPGPNDKQMLVRRWTATEAGLYMFKATLELKRGSARSDGITAWVVTDRQGVVKRFNVKTRPAKVRIERVTLEEGEQVDFVIYCGRNNNEDEFRWPVEVWKVRNAKQGGGLIGVREWPSVAAFEQASPSWLPPMGPWEQLVQAMMISNEFMFVD